MKNSIKRFFTIIIFAFCLSMPLSVHADISFPARLEITEVEPGIYDVLFVLPVMEGKVLKAKPVFPEAFNFLGKPIVDVDRNTKRIRWRVSCDPEKLAGLKIGIDGVLGSQTDVFFELSLLNGRLYAKKLSPTHAYYVIPSPPTVLGITKEAFVNGAQRLLSVYPFYLLVLVLCAFFTLKEFSKLSLNFCLFSLLGLWLATMDHLVFSKYHFDFIILLMSLFMSYGLLKRDRTDLKLTTAFIFSALLGLAFGAITRPYVNLDGFTSSNVSVYLFAVTLGVLIGCVLIILMSHKLLILLKLILKKQTDVLLGKIVGVLAFALIIYEASLYWMAPSMLPKLPYALCIFVLVSAYALKKVDEVNLLNKLLIFLLPLGFGTSFVFLGIQFPFALTIALACTWVLLLCGFYKGLQIKPLIITVVVLGAVSSGFLLAESVTANLSFALGQTMGYLIILMLVVTSILNFKTELTLEKLRPFSILFTWIAVLGLLIIWSQDFFDIEIDTFKTDYTIGLIHIPLLSLGCVFLVVMTWPRYKKIHKAMNLERKKPVLSYLFLGLTVFLMPLTVTASNPWHVFKAPNSSEIYQITQRILNNTYTAFNLKDETQLFTTLSNNLEGSLVDHVYLDSRRRLTTGLQEGAEVTVEEVTVSDIGERIETDDMLTVFKYPVEWTVKARVRHLQHIHYRQNKYLGEITLKVIDKVWKISNMTLTSEDRTIISANNK
ncbi:hypothetical protein F6U93_09310 [Tamlana haliotis]|uniref:Uncharacterized protein n=1 Tax=Pseudotamlana haliotis TaxID=2614804 RepID=A0A6N6MEL8_9FLAO|nr:hypothetical protein [Tamlana haliotis]KAB1067791.1 hypothetical protein F6U93_09310 [Tamlana haliotis]